MPEVRQVWSPGDVRPSPPLARACWRAVGGTVYLGDLPPSTTEGWVRDLVGALGAVATIKVLPLASLP